MLNFKKPGSQSGTYGKCIQNFRKYVIFVYKNTWIGFCFKYLKFNKMKIIPVIAVFICCHHINISNYLIKNLCAKVPAFPYKKLWNHQGKRKTMKHRRDRSWIGSFLWFTLPTCSKVVDPSRSPEEAQPSTEGHCVRS